MSRRFDYLCSVCESFRVNVAFTGAPVLCLHCDAVMAKVFTAPTYIAPGQTFGSDFHRRYQYEGRVEAEAEAERLLG